MLSFKECKPWLHKEPFYAKINGETRLVVYDTFSGDYLFIDTIFEWQSRMCCPHKIQEWQFVDYRKMFAVCFPLKGKRIEKEIDMVFIVDSR